MHEQAIIEKAKKQFAGQKEGDESKEDSPSKADARAKKAVVKFPLLHRILHGSLVEGSF